MTTTSRRTFNPRQSQGPFNHAPARMRRAPSLCWSIVFQQFNNRSVRWWPMIWFDGGGAARRLFSDPEGAAPKAGKRTGRRADGGWPHTYHRSLIRIELRKAISTSFTRRGGSVRLAVGCVWIELRQASKWDELGRRIGTGSPPSFPYANLQNRTPQCPPLALITPTRPHSYAHSQQAARWPHPVGSVC